MPILAVPISVAPSGPLAPFSSRAVSKFTTMKRSNLHRSLRCERLEDRRVLATFTVDSLADSGPGTLRDAIGQANRTTDFDEIVFAPELSGGTIVFGSVISIGNSLSIDATSLPDGITLDGDRNARLLRAYPRTPMALNV